MPEPYEGKSDQTREIEAALTEGGNAEAAEWNKWEESIQAQVDRLMADSRLAKLGILAAAAMGAAGIGAAALLGKGLTQLARGLEQLAANQNFMAEKLGLTQAQPVTAYNPDGSNLPESNGTVDSVKVEDAKTFDLPTDAVVGKPHEGPATEASEEAKKQLAEDKTSGVIDEFKGQDIAE